MKEAFTLQQKVKVLNKLFEADCKTEKDLQALGIEELLKIPNITIQDMTVITELQKQIKANKLFSYLGGGSNEQSGE